MRVPVLGWHHVACETVVRRWACVSQRPALNTASRCSVSPPQGRPNALWRVLAVLPYLVPLMGSLAFGQDMCVCLWPQVTCRAAL